MFDVAQWSGVAFFDPVAVGIDKDFSVTSGEESGSLADTASERDSVAPSISLSLPPHDVHGSPQSIHSLILVHDLSRGSCQKRQKIFDYGQAGHSLATKEAPTLEELGPKPPTNLEILSEKPASQ
jgi:hypothetical protein